MLRTVTGVGLTLLLGFAAPRTSAAPEIDTLQSEQPLLLLAANGGNSQTDRALRNDVLDRVRASIRAAGRYRVLAVNPDQPLIKRAVLDRQLGSADLLEPISQDSVRRIARVVGAQTVLWYALQQQGADIVVHVRVEDHPAPEVWTVRLQQDLNLPHVTDRRVKENRAEAAADAIGAQVGVPAKRPQRIVSTDPAPPAKPKRPGKTASPPRPSPASNAEARPHGSLPTAPTAAVATPPAAASPGAVSSAPEPSEGPDDAIELPNPAGEPIERKAEQFAREGDIANAVVCYREAISLHPTDIGLRVALCRAYLAKKLNDLALSEVKRGLKLDPANADLYAMLGSLQQASGESAQSLDSLRAAAKLNPGAAVPQVQLGDALLAAGKVPEAIAAYEAAVKLDGASPLPHIRIARAYLVKASEDPAAYALAASEIGKARERLPVADTATYQSEYTVLARQMAGRIRGFADDIEADWQKLTRAPSQADALHAADGYKRRLDAAAEFLDKTPPAAQQEVTHGMMQQAMALVQQALDVLREQIARPAQTGEAAFKDAILEARRGVSAAEKRIGPVNAGK